MDERREEQVVEALRQIAARAGQCLGDPELDLTDSLYDIRVIARNSLRVYEREKMYRTA